MSAVDARLLGWGRPTRIFLTAAVLVGAAQALLVVAQAWLLALIIAGAFIDGKDLGDLKVPLALLLAVVVMRALMEADAGTVSAGDMEVATPGCLAGPYRLGATASAPLRRHHRRERPARAGRRQRR